LRFKDYHYEKLCAGEKETAMALSEMEENDIKRMVLMEVENMFTSISYKYNIKENQEMMHFLLDIESNVKQSLVDAKQSQASISI
jgi:hypothetical protein